MSSVHIQVVAGIIYNADQSKILLSLRKSGQHQGNRWEFPGGKVEASESIDEALARELSEELGISPTHSQPFCEITHQYPEKSVHLHFYSVFSFSGTPSGQEQQRLGWYLLSELQDLTFPEANLSVVQKLLEPVG